MGVHVQSAPSGLAPSAPPVQLLVSPQAFAWAQLAGTCGPEAGSWGPLRPAPTQLPAGPRGAQTGCPCTPGAPTQAAPTQLHSLGLPGPCAACTVLPPLPPPRTDTVEVTAVGPGGPETLAGAGPGPAREGHGPVPGQREGILAWTQPEAFPLRMGPGHGQAMLGNDGVEFHVCSARGGRCFFGCRPGWQWISHCHSLLSCCKWLQKNKPAHYYDVEH
ncbi:Beta-defensin 136 [Galemys pyrenaicus]|uniref:Beta-defensin 136 n=1 Tax=Galemys pyrenaicus TaxID=202257 RepID=A0A8J5ZSM9_GALPY|nr:Beta-defensin 136 [Galemys pyrenaicus]